MKTILEFDDTQENFDRFQYNRVLMADDLAFCISKIKDQLREWYKYDSRGNIPFDEVCETLHDIITETVDTEKTGY